MAAGYLGWAALANPATTQTLIKEFGTVAYEALTEQQVLGAALAANAGDELIGLAKGFNRWYEKLLFGQRFGPDFFSLDVASKGGRLTGFARTGDGTTSSVNLNGVMDFVITKEGILRVGSGHSHLSGQANSVLAAGQISLEDGVGTQISNQSGHYKPSEEMLTKFKDYFEQLGLNVSKTKTTTDDLTRQ